MKFRFPGTSVNFLVEISGIEPLTSCLQGRRSPSWAKPPSNSEVVGQNGLEPSTSRLSVVCSSQLSYWPISTSHFLGTFLMYPLNWITHWQAFSLVLTLGHYKQLHRVTWSLLRKEVIQPHLPIRLPCYDFTPITGPTFGRALLSVRLRTSGVPDSHGVTGGVYKARERIHRGFLIRDY